MGKSKKKIILAGGGTAGHVSPLLEVAKALSANGSFEFEMLGTGSDFERAISRKNRIAYQKIFSGKLRRNPGILSVLQNIADFFLLGIGVIQTIFLFWGERPSLIFSKGGFASVPAVIGGAFWGVPIIAHESDVIPGLANRIALKYVKRIATAFPLDVYPLKIKRKAFFSGIPLQEGFYESSNLKDGKYILIFGGSQGASSLNEMLFEQLEKILKIAPVVHLTGKLDYERATGMKAKLPKNLAERYSVYDFREDMDKLIGGARMVICRAGANSIFETAAFSKRLLLVPIPASVTKHQTLNALYLKSKGMGEVFAQGGKGADFVNLIAKTYNGKSGQIDALRTPWSAGVIADSILSEIENEKFIHSINKIFFIGIGGVSMKGLSMIFEKMGKKVFGSDLKLGGHRAENIKPDIDLVVYSSAASADSLAREEHEQAKKYDIKIIKRSEAIGILMRNKSGISVSGMHGKTTTSALISRTLQLSGFDPSYLIGAQATKYVPTANYSTNEYFVAEACEYDGSFLDLPTTIAIVTNIEEEHLDYFKNGLKEIIGTFGKFVKNIRSGGLLIYNADDKNSVKLIGLCREDLGNRGITLRSFGSTQEADIKISAYSVNDEKVTFKLKDKNVSLAISPRVVGKHFAYNCACAYAVSSYLGVDPDVFITASNSFLGAKGRFEFVGSKKGIPVFYDYGHHPTELRAVFSSINDLYKDKRKFFIFEPHQQDRFNNFFDDFYREILNSKMDIVGILPVYRVAGRDAEAKFTSRDLVDKLSKSGKKVFLFENYDEATLFLRKNHRSGDFVITVGATDVWKVAEEFIKD